MVNYYVGAIPFWLGLLYFIADIGRNAYAAARLTEASPSSQALRLAKVLADRVRKPAASDIARRP